MFEPTPLRRVRQQDPYGLSECAGKMRDGCVDRDDEIEQTDRGRGFGKIGEFFLKIHDLNVDSERMELRGAFALLQRIQLDALDLANRQQGTKLDRSVCIALVPRPTCPGNAHLQAAGVTREPPRPALDPKRVHAEVRHVSRDRIEIRAEHPWETHDVDVIVELWQGLVLPQNAVDSVEGSRDLIHAGSILQHDVRTESLQPRRESNELDNVADALFGANQDRLSGKVLARPDRLFEIRAQRRQQVLKPPELVMIPTFGEPPGGQQRHAVVPLGEHMRAPRELAFEDF